LYIAGFDIKLGESRDAKVQFSSVRSLFSPNLNLNHLWEPEPEPEPELNLFEPVQ